MGPALAIKAVAGRHFSVLVFGIAQVAMDIEPLVGMIRGAEVLHGWSHSYVGATAIGLLVMLLAPPICLPILRRWNHELRHHGAAWLSSPERIGLRESATGAFVGTYSHVVLDSIMHSDITPFAPWSSANGLQSLMSINALHTACIVTGLAGIAGWFILALWRKRKQRQN